mmetsp:Transcript_23842/g.81523  ORF Transcript_23842/g.81523 Transcript_23842/m.81523 type:complete len:322 (-) Transcript_23842:49-1014(-)
MQRVGMLFGLSSALVRQARFATRRRGVVRLSTETAPQSVTQDAAHEVQDLTAAAAFDPARVRSAVRTLAAAAGGVSLGITAPTASGAVATLKAWTDALKLPPATLGADEATDVDADAGAAFLQYGPNGEASLRRDAAAAAGVLFYPQVAAGGDVSVAQYLLPLGLFDDDDAPADAADGDFVPLTGKQKLVLRGRAVTLGGKLPTLDLPRDGATAPFLKQLEEYVKHHELVKVRMPFVGKKKAAKLLAEADLVPATRSELVQVMGHTCLLYRAKNPPVIDVNPPEKEELPEKPAWVPVSYDSYDDSLDESEASEASKAPASS